MYNSTKSEPIFVKIDEETSIIINTSTIIGEEEVSLLGFKIEDLTKQIKRFSSAVLSSIKDTGLSKASIEFGVNAAIKSGKLTALIAEGTSQANLKITLEWNNGK